MLDGTAGPPTVTELVDVMESTQRERTPEFLAGLDDPAYVRAFLGRPVGRLGPRRTSPPWTATAGPAR